MTLVFLDGMCLCKMCSRTFTPSYYIFLVPFLFYFCIYSTERTKIHRDKKEKNLKENRGKKGEKMRLTYDKC